jgi:hypothetical protein
MSLFSQFAHHRLLLYYKGDISALTMFAQQANGSVCFPTPLPALSSPLEEDEAQAGKISMHPASLVNAINQILHLDNDLLMVEPGYTQQIDAPGGIITVHMARFKVLDPPHKIMSVRDCTMKTLPELRGRPPAEMELLRRAYIQVMEG